MSIVVKNLYKQFGTFQALDDVSLEAESGSLLALLGPSGSGKTTLLRIIAGLESADRGVVLYQDEDVTKQSPKDRQVGFVFQHYALFRHMTVFENVAFGMRVRKRPNAEINARVHELLHLVRLEGLNGRYPAQLSGGQRQRVALARALAVQPRILLLDEPFGALDAKVRQELRQWLRQLHDEIHLTTVFVTHDQEEAFEVADRVVVMRAGHIEQAGTPQEVFDHPATPFVMDFLGNVNVFHGRVENGMAMLGALNVAYPEYPHAESRNATAYVRPHELDIERMPFGDSSLEVRVMQLNPAGSVAKVRVFSEQFGLALSVDLSLERYSELQLTPGDRVFVAARRVRVFTKDAQDYSI
ncbi:sulfate/molybdate ABC transporter ATP-binding protein [Schlesneria paludicola]|uniref:sulfate/molybdate ABC transporter ATP-binding protein n=1 Tax=Schlesneria paludicola TaxID=360056 RepID=UPI00029A7B98|nr:sulfate ABC transporter ATP-binding protein [Schlesneria paludicola]